MIIEDGLFSSIAKLMKLSGNYTIKPVATNNYLFCNMEVTQILDTQIPLPTYSKDKEYAWIVDLVKFFGDKISIKEVIEYFAADMYIYRYIG